YTAIKPEGAFYLFVKALEEDANAFAERAKKYELLVVPADSFGVKGYVRIAYCVSPDTVKRSLPAFKSLAESYLNK
ncbi:MAG: pyridoxal phosphate-dependent aminotransferase, partial [Candidatus Coproplasma sp.]